MPDYAAMYRRLFQAQTQAITILQKAQQDAEEMHMSAPDPVIWVLDKTDDDEQEPEE